ncbi:MAG TPA: putative quinol monooxygenase [Dehalococcoidia bacterium]|nr:putative quinol monooxygenase [Dehalococcoidia bacterium]
MVSSEPSADGETPEAVTLILTMPIKAEFEGDFLAMSREFVAKIHANEPGTLLFVITRHPEREHTYVLVERYRDEAAFAVHRDSPYLAAIRPKLAQYLDGRPELLRLEQVIPD